MTQDDNAINQSSISDNEQFKKDLISQYEPNDSSVSHFDLKMPPNARGYVILGNTLGSGEQLLINQIINKIPPFLKVFICYQNEFLACSGFIRENYASPIERIVAIDELVSVAGGIINLDWTEPSNLKNLLHEVGLMGAGCIVIFASGSNAASKVKKQMKLVSHLCQKLFVAVNIHDRESFHSAKKLANDQDLPRLNFGCWQKIELDEGYQHNFRIFSANEFNEYFAGR
ncbi:hypothetical protein NQU96_07205 [Pseudoalteromonas elyakovii]|nr:hypothetical protein [Pseudoalteromonas elyakovii]